MDQASPARRRRGILDLQAWMKNGKHLPPEMRDFHDQKDLFKAIDEWAGPQNPRDLIKRPDWTAAQCFVIDLFLRYMAAHGYTLQRVRQPGPFHDLATSVGAAKKQRDEMFSAMLKQGMAKPPPTAQAGDSA